MPLLQMYFTQKKEVEKSLVFLDNGYPLISASTISKAYSLKCPFIRPSINTLHRPAPCYETATTRKYYHGRTATVRSTTKEAINWCKAMNNPDLSVTKKFINVS